MPNNYIRYHQNLANYFKNKPLWIQKEKQDNPNVRKVIEQPWQQIIAGMWCEASTTLTDWNFFIAGDAINLRSNINISFLRYFNDRKADTNLTSLAEFIAVGLAERYISNIPVKNDQNNLRSLDAVMQDLKTSLVRSTDYIDSSIASAIISLLISKLNPELANSFVKEARKQCDAVFAKTSKHAIALASLASAESTFSIDSANSIASTAAYFAGAFSGKESWEVAMNTGIILYVADSNFNSCAKNALDWITNKLNSTRVYNEFPELRKYGTENAALEVQSMQKEYINKAKQMCTTIESKINSLPTEYHLFALAFYLTSFLNNNLVSELLKELGHIVCSYSGLESMAFITTMCNIKSDVTEALKDKSNKKEDMMSDVSFLESLPSLNKLDLSTWYDSPKDLNDRTNLSFLFASRIAALWIVDKEASESMAQYAFTRGYLFNKEMINKCEYGSGILNYYLNLAEFLFNDLEIPFVPGEQIASGSLHLRGLIGFARAIYRNNLHDAIDLASRFGILHPYILTIIGIRLSMCNINERTSLYRAFINDIWNKKNHWPEGCVSAILLAESRINSKEFSLTLQKYSSNLIIFRTCSLLDSKNIFRRKEV